MDQTFSTLDHDHRGETIEQDLNDDFPLLSDYWFDDEEDLDLFSSRGETKTDDHITHNDLRMDMESLQKPILSSSYSDGGGDMSHDLQLRLNIINKTMGSMALCRGRNGDTLREAGAIHAALSLLHHLIPSFDLIPHLHQQKILCHDEKFIDLAISALGALRDLACGSSSNRHAIGSFNYLPSPDITHPIIPIHGMQLIAWFVQRQHLVSWEDIVSLDASSSRNRYKELRLLTTAIAAIRNTAHSNRVNSDILQTMGLTQTLIWRLLHGNAPANVDDSDQQQQRQPQLNLPDPSVPWREACFRIASALVNMSENNVNCAGVCASNDAVVELLLTAWDDDLLVNDDDDDDDDESQVKKCQHGRSIPLLHPGLANILSKWKEKINKNVKLSCVVEAILHREEERKIASRLREQKSSSRIVIMKNE